MQKIDHKAVDFLLLFMYHIPGFFRYGGEQIVFDHQVAVFHFHCPVVKGDVGHIVVPVLFRQQAHGQRPCRPRQRIIMLQRGVLLFLPNKYAVILLNPLERRG